MAKAIDIRSAVAKKHNLGAPVMATFDRVGDTVHGEPYYSVTVDGTVVGYVARSERRWGKRPAGSRIYTSTGMTTAWAICNENGHGELARFDSRNEAARAILRG